MRVLSKEAETAYAEGLAQGQKRIAELEQALADAIDNAPTKMEVMRDFESDAIEAWKKENASLKEQLISNQETAGVKSDSCNYPWRQTILNDWNIVDMNHYHIAGERMLFVAMIKDGKRITEEGPDDEYLWNRLCHKAWGEI